MKRKELKSLMKEAISEALGESFISNIVEMVVQTTQKTIKTTIEEEIQKAVKKQLVVEKKTRLKESNVKKGGVNSKPKTRKKSITPLPQKSLGEQVKLSKNPIFDKLLKQTMNNTAPGQLEDYGTKLDDLQQLGADYKQGLIEAYGESGQLMADQAPSQQPIAQSVIGLSENLGVNTLQTSVMDNKALSSIFKKDYRSTLKKMKESSGAGLPEAVQFFEG